MISPVRGRVRAIADGCRRLGSPDEADEPGESLHRVVYLWTFTGHAAGTANALIVHGWEEWDVGNDLKVQSSRGWYGSEDYARQVAGGTA